MAATNQTVIKMEDVTKVFYTDEVETHALSGIHLEIRKGEYVSMAGPSGCGKSTLLSIVGLLDSPTTGAYVLNQKPVQGLDFAERARIRNQEIGFIFQSFNLIGDLTVYENVELPLTYRDMASDERKRRVHDALERVGGPPRPALSIATIWRSATTRRRCPRTRRRASHPAGGRTYRKPGLKERRSGHGTTA
jgi:putative ABC transport system ATP-binding protein